MTANEASNYIRNLVGDAYLYAYNPKDRRGVRYVFAGKTVLGRSAAIKYAEELAATDVADQIKAKKV